MSFDKVRDIKLAADAGNAHAQFELAEMLMDGATHLGKDLKEAVEFYREAARQGHARALYELGQCHFKGVAGLPIDKRKAERLWRKAGDRGCGDACFQIAKLHHRGDAAANFPMSEPEARKWWARGAELGHAASQYKAGRMAMDEGHTHDAVELFRKAAEQGHAGGEYMMGCAYEEGWAGASDLLLALKYYRRAADQDQDSKHRRSYKTLFSKLRPQMQSDTSWFVGIY